jgi:hypothetical protein
MKATMTAPLFTTSPPRTAASRVPKERSVIGALRPATLTRPAGLAPAGLKPGGYNDACGAIGPAEAGHYG